MDLKEFKEQYLHEYDDIYDTGLSRATSLLPSEDICYLADNKDDFDNYLISMEECSELQKAISKFYREGYDVNDNKLRLIEEMADMQITLEILQRICNIDDLELKAAYNVKMRRNLERLKYNENNSVKK